MSAYKKIPNNINDVPVVFVRTASGIIEEKISINELKRRNKNNPDEGHRIKLYRAALDHYVNENYDLAELLLVQLIKTSESFNYEYYERLANLFRTQGKTDLEIEILGEALEQLKETHSPENLIERVERRLQKYQQAECSAYHTQPSLKADF